MVVERNAEEQFTREEVLSVSREFGVLNQIEFQGRSFAGANIKNYKITRPHQLIYTKSPLKANPYGIIQSSRENEGILSVLYAVLQPFEGSANSEFAEHYFALDGRLNSYLHKLVNKGAKNTLLISDDGSLEGKVTFPSQLFEQKRIAAFLDKIDSLITLHQRKRL